jgi:serine/threonine protein kinase
MRAGARRIRRRSSRFVKEAQLLQELEHPHLVKGTRVAQEGDVIFFAMEKLPGRSLQDVLGGGGRLTRGRAGGRGRGGGALDDAARARPRAPRREARQRALVRGARRRADRPRLRGQRAIGGLARDDRGHRALHRARTGARHRHLDVRADIYALGANALPSRDGSLPFEGARARKCCASRCSSRCPASASATLGLSPQVHYFIEKMMAKEREIRFQDPQQLQREIESFLQQRQAAARARRTADQEPQEARRPWLDVRNRRRGRGRR